MHQGQISIAALARVELTGEELYNCYEPLQSGVPQGLKECRAGLDDLLGVSQYEHIGARGHSPEWEAAYQKSKKFFADHWSDTFTLVLTAKQRVALSGMLKGITADKIATFYTVDPESDGGTHFRDRFGVVPFPLSEMVCQSARKKLLAVKPQREHFSAGDQTTADVVAEIS